MYSSLARNSMDNSPTYINTGPRAPINVVAMIDGLLDRSIAFQRPFVALGVGVTGALMLSQAIYWSKRTKNPDRWFYKTQTEWEEETGMTRREQETARKKLKELGLIEEVKRGIPCRVFFRVDHFALYERLCAHIEQSCMDESATQDAPNSHTSMAESAKLDCTKAPSSSARNRQSNTESTETTSESTYRGTEAVPSPLAAETPQQADCIPYEKIRDLYNQMLGGALPRCLGLDDKHRKRIRAAYNLKLDGKFVVREGGMDFWEGLFNDALECPFLLGQNNRGWIADFEFMTSATKIQRFMEGKYDAR